MNTNTTRFAPGRGPGPAHHVPQPATVLSRAAGTSRAKRRDVDPPKGPVLLNYGLDECRFVKPVYPEMTIQVRFTVKEKVDQEKRTPEDVAKGIVKFLVDVFDETGETVAIATILTMVKKLDQS